MVAGVNSLNSYNISDNAYLKRKHKHEKFVNNLNHNIASAGVIGLGGTGIYAANKFADTKAMQAIDAKLTQGANYIADGGLKKVYQKTADKAKEIINRAKEHAPKMPDKVQNILTGAKEGAKKVFNAIKEFSAPVVNKLKAPAQNLLTKAKGLASNLLNKFAKMPAKYKVGGAIGMITLLVLGAINSDKAYKNGKIDQKYTNAAKM